MKPNILILFLIVCLSGGIFGCSSSGQLGLNLLKHKDSNNSSMIITCAEPRPQFCTMEYQPVCAKLSDESIKTYASGCTACSDSAVTSHREGPCE